MIHRNFTYASILNSWRAHFKNLSQKHWSTRRPLSICACTNARTHRLTPPASAAEGIPRCANPESWSPQNVDDFLNRRNDVDLHAALCLFPHVRTPELTVWRDPQAPLKAFLGAKIQNHGLLKTLTIFKIIATTLICTPRCVYFRT